MPRETEPALLQHAIGLLAVLAATLWTPSPGAAQERAWVAVATNAPGAVLYADSVRVGPAGTGPLQLEAGARRLRLLIPGAGDWSAQPVERDVDVPAGDTVLLTMHVPYRYRIDSVPFGAIVHLESDSSRSAPLGETPLLLERQSPITDKLVLRRDGYHPQPVEPGDALWNNHTVVLSPVPSAHESAAAVEVEWRPPSSRRTQWIDYAALGIGVAAAVVAVHYKFKADRLYDEYQETGDLSLREPIERYDRISGTALIGMQAGIAIFGLRLILR